MNELSTSVATRPAQPSAGKLPATRAGSSVAMRIRATTAIIVPYISYSAQQLGRAGITGLSLGIFSLIVFVSGNLQIRQKISAQTTELASVRARAATRNLTGDNHSPQFQASRFVSHLPGRRDVPQIMGQIVTIAAATGIELARGNYEFVSSAEGAIAHYRMALPVSGTYPQVRQFVENLLESVPAIALDNMRIERDSVSDEVITADLRFSILLSGDL